MNTEQSLSHTKWECKYHLTWIPKYRKKELYGDLLEYLGEVFHDLGFVLIEAFRDTHADIGLPTGDDIGRCYRYHTRYLLQLRFYGIDGSAQFGITDLRHDHIGFRETQVFLFHIMQLVVYNQGTSNKNNGNRKLGDY